jgi:hypothetical protein
MTDAGKTYNLTRADVSMALTDLTTKPNQRRSFVASSSYSDITKQAEVLLQQADEHRARREARQPRGNAEEILDRIRRESSSDGRPTAGDGYQRTDTFTAEEIENAVDRGAGTADAEALIEDMINHRLPDLDANDYVITEDGEIYLYQGPSMIRGEEGVFTSATGFGQYKLDDIAPIRRIDTSRLAQELFI